MQSIKTDIEALQNIVDSMEGQLREMNAYSLEIICKEISKQSDGNINWAEYNHNEERCGQMESAISKINAAIDILGDLTPVKIRVKGGSK